MINLAGPHSDEKDQAIGLELLSAGIDPAYGDKPVGEVQSKVTGNLGAFTFERAWYYWRVSGLVPIEMAREIYADEIGQRDVRVVGHCGCPPPEEWAHTYATADGFVQCVDHYHIDSQQGLNLFVKMAHKHGIVERPIAVLGWTVEATESLLKEMTDELIRSSVGRIIASRRFLRDVDTDDPRIIDLVRRCKEAHP